MCSKETSASMKPSPSIVLWRPRHRRAHYNYRCTPLFNLPASASAPISFVPIFLHPVHARLRTASLSAQRRGAKRPGIAAFDTAQDLGLEATRSATDHYRLRKFFESRGRVAAQLSLALRTLYDLRISADKVQSLCHLTDKSYIPRQSNIGARTVSRRCKIS